MKYYFLLLIAFLLLGFSAVSANGFGIKLDQTVGDYIVNVDADAYSFTSGEPVNFMFMLWNKDRTERADFDNVWVSITPKGSYGNVFGGLLGEPEFGGFRMTYTFPQAGDYNISVRLGKNNGDTIDTIAEASFPVTVDQGEAESLSRSNPKEIIFSLIIGLMVGALSFSFLKKKNY